MSGQRSRIGSYVLATLVGAIGGGILVALATEALPKIMSQMEEHMGPMMARMKESGFEPPEQ